ncbi:MAG: hypothetical protein HQL53_01065 [Magnetococcales bacterium]|nr:hypothetical protein [Magnetococcales bacterium]
MLSLRWMLLLLWVLIGGAALPAVASVELAEKRGEDWSKIPPLGETPLMRLSPALSSHSVKSAISDQSRSSSGKQHPIFQKLGIAPEALSGLNLPPPSDGPVRVKVGLKILTIPEVNEPQENFHIHAAYDLEWYDPRLASKQRSKSTRFREEEASLLMRYIWRPDVDFFNGTTAPQIDNRMLIVEPDGWMRLHVLLDLPLSYHSHLRLLPFDEQELPILLEIFGVGANEVLLEPHQERSGYERSFLPPDWNIIEFKSNSSLRKADLHGDGMVSQVAFRLHVKRDGQYFLWRVMLPMVLVVMVTWWIYWVPVEVFVSRLEIGLIGILTLVAFNLSVMDAIPNISYLTLLDLFYLIGLMAIFIAVLESLWLSQMANEQGEMERAQKINKRFRHMAPAMTLLAWGSVLMLPMLMG